MKKKVNFLFALATAGLLWTGCSNESEELIPNPGNPEGEKSGITLVISNGDKATRAASGTEGATTTEKAIDPDKGLKVYVFNNNGSLDYSGNLALRAAASPGMYETTTAFEVTAETGKYFFVFANDGTNKITAPGAATTMNEFMAQNFAVAVASGAPDIATGNFLMGSLWKETTDVPLDVNTQRVNVSIGRLASKVVLAEVKNVSDASLKGDFSDPKFRLGTIALKSNKVGVYEGASSPLGNTGVIVKSAVHDATGWTLAGDGITPVANVNYQPFNTVWTSSLTPSATAAFYATENTTGLDVDGLQYYGNTTFIQLQTVYTPGAGEVYLQDLTVDASYDPDVPLAKFYTARIKSSHSDADLAGKWIIFSEKPATGTAHADIDLDVIKEYTGGLNYHKFAIYDKNETNVVAKNRVLRNHYYQFTVKNFKSLGEPTDFVDPKEPIPNKTSVDVEVEVKDWDKVEADDVEV